jgi:thymidylate synthase (FAD)
VHVGVFIEGISRGCSHEIVRHRMFNYSQRSTRYTAEDDAAIVLDPFFANIYVRSGMENHVADEDPAFIEEQCTASGVTTEQYNLVAQFLDNCSVAFDAYNDTVSSLDALVPSSLAARDRRKWCRGKARQILPHALETRMVMTGNLRAWRHFFLMRTSRHAEAEIRRLAEQIYLTVQPIAPTVFEDLEAVAVDGFLELNEAA